jgi:hypothetical protein
MGIKSFLKFAESETNARGTEFPEKKTILQFHKNEMLKYVAHVVKVIIVHAVISA